jgi:hypothetical protein
MRSITGERGVLEGACATQGGLNVLKLAASKGGLATRRLAFRIALARRLIFPLDVHVGWDEACDRLDQLGEVQCKRMR